MAKKPHIYGINAIAEAIQAGKTIEKIWVDKNVRNPHMSALQQQARQGGIPLQFVPPGFFNKYQSKNHQGAMALTAAIEYIDYTEIITRLFENGENPLVLMLDGVTDVRNLGAIARSAVGMGVHLIVVPAKGSAAISEDAVKTSAGALFHIPVSRVPHLGDCLLYLKDAGLQTIACTEKATENLDSADFTHPTVLVIGSEEKGIEKSTLRNCTASVKIPMSAALESLNVSVAAGVLLYEVARQRRFSFSNAEIRHF